MDSNPFKSPPPDLLAEGLSTVMTYLRVRMRRIEVVHSLIVERYYCRVIHQRSCFLE